MNDPSTEKKAYDPADGIPPVWDPGSQILSRDKKTIYIVQADGSWKKSEREQYEGEWEEVNGAQV